MRTDVPAEDVEHAGDILDRGRWVQFARRPESRIWSIDQYRERPAERVQSVSDC